MSKTTCKRCLETKMSGKNKRIFYTGVFVSEIDLNELLEIRNKIVTEKELPTVSVCHYGFDYDGRMVQVCEGVRKELDVYLTKAELEVLNSVIDGITAKYGFPKPTDRCVIGVQKNKEITITVELQG